MIVALIIIIAGLVWLGKETDWFTARLTYSADDAKYFRSAIKYTSLVPIRLGRWQHFALAVLVVVTFFLHIAVITQPGEPVFDEVHYITDARRILAGEGSQRNEHPPLARLIIAGSMKVVGDDPWGWRLPAVILSTIGLMLFYDICRRLKLSHRAAFIATFLLALENLTFIHSGLAMLDIYMLFFTILAFWCYLRGWWWAAAVSVALASLSKFSGILSAVPIGLHWLAVGYKGSLPQAPPNPDSRWLDRFMYRYGRPLGFILSMLLAPIVFVLGYQLLDFAVWGKWINAIKDIKDALSATNSIKFSYSGAFPSRPWEWLLSPSGSFYFYGWLVNPGKYPNILLPYWYTPHFTGILSPTLWLSGLAAIPVAIWQSIKKNAAAIFALCWFIGAWAVWIPLSIATDRITYMFYYLPTIGAVCLVTSMILSGLLDKTRARQRGALKGFLETVVALFLLLHLVAFCLISPVKLWISIPACLLLLLFTLDYLGYSWRFLVQTGVAVGAWTPILCYSLVPALIKWTGSSNDYSGYPQSGWVWLGASAGSALSVAIIFLMTGRLLRRFQPALPPPDEGMATAPPPPPPPPLSPTPA